MKFDKSFGSLTESYLKVPARRLFYPRNFQLSEDFVGAFRGEYKRLVDEGHNPKQLMQRFAKALQFHIDEGSGGSAKCAAQKAKRAHIDAHLDKKKELED